MISTEAAVGNAGPLSGNPNLPTILHVNGYWTPQSIVDIDATRLSASTTGMPAGFDPFTPVTDGSWTAWMNIYAFTVNNTAPGPVTISSYFQMRSGYAATQVGSVTYLGIEQATSPASPGFTYTFSFAETVTPVPLPPIPTPAGAAAIGLFGLIAARRRR